MLDDCCDSVSDKQFEYGAPWSGITNHCTWRHVLGDPVGTEEVTPYQAPPRAIDLSDPPQAYIDDAECEVFRDPAVIYAMNMWRCASTCKLHVWPGGVHLFDAVNNPEVLLVTAAIATKQAWLKRIISKIA